MKYNTNTLSLAPKVSVIVPVYNAGPFLDKCLNTLVHQSLQELEIILVLDCPTDGSDRVAETYASQYYNIRLVYNKQNFHISESRNRGLELASGEYIGFSDADDYQDLQMFEKMYICAKDRNADALFIDVKTVHHPESYSERDLNVSQRKIQDNSEFAKDCFLKLLAANHHLANGTIYSHLYRRDFLNCHHIRFVDSKKIISEDHLFNIQVYHEILKQQGKLIYLPESYYYYNIHASSICHTSGYREISKSIALLEQIPPIIKEDCHISESIVFRAYGERVIRYLFTAWRTEIGHNGLLAAFKNLSRVKHSIPIKKGFSSYSIKYNKQLTLTKNCFARVLKLFYLRK